MFIYFPSFNWIIPYRFELRYAYKCFFSHAVIFSNVKLCMLRIYQRFFSFFDPKHAARWTGRLGGGGGLWMSSAVLTVRAETDPSHSCLDIKYFWKPQIALFFCFLLNKRWNNNNKNCHKVPCTQLISWQECFFFFNIKKVIRNWTQS